MGKLARGTTPSKHSARRKAHSILPRHILQYSPRTEQGPKHHGDLSCCRSQLTGNLNVSLQNWHSCFGQASDRPSHGHWQERRARATGLHSSFLIFTLRRSYCTHHFPAPYPSPPCDLKLFSPLRLVLEVRLATGRGPREDEGEIKIVKNKGQGNVSAGTHSKAQSLGVPLLPAVGYQGASSHSMYDGGCRSKTWWPISSGVNKCRRRQG